MARTAKDVGAILPRRGKAVALRATLGMPGTFTRVGWQLPANMPIEQWFATGLYLAKVEGAVQWWFGDWWAFGEHAYGARKALFEEGGPLADMNFQTIANYGWVAKAVTTSVRTEVLSWQHHLFVAALSPAEQRRWLKLAIRNELSANELRAQIKRQAVNDRIAQNGVVNRELSKHATIVVDVPWDMDFIERDTRPNQVAFDYPPMNEDQLMAFGRNVLLPLAADDCHLFMWTTLAFRQMALRLLEAWDFRHCVSGDMIWHKPGGFQPTGLPQFNYEPIVYGRRGAPEFTTTQEFKLCNAWPRSGHSRKPKEFYELIKRVTPGPRIDMFARERHDGFEQWGNEIDRFTDAAE